MSVHVCVHVSVSVCVSVCLNLWFLKLWKDRDVLDKNSDQMKAIHELGKVSLQALLNCHFYFH